MSVGSPLALSRPMPGTTREPLRRRHQLQLESGGTTAVQDASRPHSPQTDPRRELLFFFRFCMTVGRISPLRAAGNIAPCGENQSNRLKAMPIPATESPLVIKLFAFGSVTKTPPR